MLKAFFLNGDWKLWAWGGLFVLLVSLFLQVQLTVSINEWYGTFYNMLQVATEHDVSEFWDSLMTFFYLAMPYVFLATATSWFTRIYAFRWRQAITFNYIPRWQKVNEDIEGSSQRIQEDAYRFAKIVETLGLQIVRAFMIVLAFIPILWSLSSGVTIEPFASIPGSLVWLAIAVSFGGIIISWFVGWFLPGLEYNNQKIEAAFRKELVLGEDDKVNHAKTETLVELFTGLRVNYQRLFNHYSYFDIWTNTLSQFMIVAPYIVMGPSLFSGVILLGVLVQVSNAFQKVYQAFSLPIENWTTITELRSIWKRLHEFENNLAKHE